MQIAFDAELEAIPDDYLAWHAAAYRPPNASPVSKAEPTLLAPDGFVFI
jgi:hypothetical protein